MELDESNHFEGECEMERESVCGGKKRPGNKFATCDLDGIGEVCRKISYQSQPKRFSTGRMKVG